MQKYEEPHSNRSTTNVTHWALLIGISYYREESLKGCVRDVQLLQQYLCASPQLVDIQVLSASNPEDAGTSTPLEPAEIWPTYDNVLTNLIRIKKGAKPGDLVYVHYSGHGTKVERSSQDDNDDGIVEDLALDLYDAEHGIRYLKGRTIAKKFSEMVQSGLLLTVVLDCCFSGSVVRTSEIGAVRSLPYDRSLDVQYSEVALPENADTASFLRNMNTLPRLLVDPQGYTILTACGPDERATEIDLPSGESHGALSFFLVYALNSIRKRGIDSTHRSLYELLRVQFHAKWPSQTPMRYGNPDLSFFGNPVASPQAALILANKEPNDQYMRLHAGYAHGISPGDEFAVCSFHSSANLDLSRPGVDWAKATAITVGSLTTELDVITDDIPKTYNNIWKAKLLTSLSPDKIRFYIPRTLRHHEDILDAKEPSRFIAIVNQNEDSSPSFHFKVALNEENCIEILDHSNKILSGVPPVQRNLNATGEMIKLIEHVGAFKYFEGLENRAMSDAFQQSFTLNLESQSGERHNELGGLSVKEDTILILTITNLGTKPLYFCVFDLGPSWQIDNLLSVGGEGGFDVIPPKSSQPSSKRVGFKTNVPASFRERGQLACDDVLKVFITSSATSFAPWILPKIRQRYDDGHAKRITKFLEYLSGHIRSDGGLAQEQWATQNFIIHTTASMDNS